MKKSNTFRVAIACQGGGSHTAFTAGALRKILQNQYDHFEITALSGTSGGAICAFLTWYGLLKDNPALSINLLENFWKEAAAKNYWEALGNTAVVLGQSQMPGLELSPYWFPDWARDTLQAILQRLVDFDTIPALIRKESPELHIGAVDVISGDFKLFRNQEVTVEALLASAAIPTIFKAMDVAGRFYWDGLFSQNPPIRDLAKTKPDELWVIQINPSTRSEVPRTMEAIHDRRNELAGNLSLQQELYFIEKINEFVDSGAFGNSAYKRIGIKRVILERDLSYASKLDRGRRFINDLISYGADQADQLFVALAPQAEMKKRKSSAGGPGQSIPASEVDMKPLSG